MYITEPISRSNKMVVAFIFGHKELLRYLIKLSKKKVKALPTTLILNLFVEESN